MLALTSSYHHNIIKNDYIWKYLYTRDFNRSFPQTTSISTEYLYYITSMNQALKTDREKTINNMMYSYSRWLYA